MFNSKAKKLVLLVSFYLANLLKIAFYYDKLVKNKKLGEAHGN